MLRSVTILFLLVIGLSAALADILHVPDNYSTIQGAMNAAINGDTVLVAAGTYVENINFRGKNITVTSNFIFDQDPQTVVNTVIDGSNPVQPDTGSCVVISSGEDTSAVLEGFTLTGGIGTKWIDEHGAGTYVEGGGILVQYSSPTICHNRIVGNFAIRVLPGVTSAGGGAIRVGDSDPRILNNIIMNNEGMYGGGIVLNYSGGTIKNNVIASNRVYAAAGSAPTFGGGGLWVSGNFTGAPKIIENNTIIANSSSGGGGGAYSGRGGGILVAGTTVTVRNNIVWDNTQTIGGQIGVIQSGTANVTYSDVEEGFSGTGNINVDPSFADSSYYLQAGSPCIDSGDSSTTFNDPEDPLNPGSALWPASGNLRSDIGAYGGPGSSVLGAFVVTSVGESQEGQIPNQFYLGQNYPNPFNPETDIRYRISDHGLVRLTIYDVLGREVATLVNEQQSPGTYNVAWNASGFASGLYVYQLRTGDFAESRKMLFIR